MSIFDNSQSQVNQSLIGIEKRKSAIHSRKESIFEKNKI